MIDPQGILKALSESTSKVSNFPVLHFTLQYKSTLSALTIHTHFTLNQLFKTESLPSSPSSLSPSSTKRISKKSKNSSRVPALPTRPF
jgi:hypothetical protein